MTREHVAEIAEDPETVDLYTRTVGAGVAVNVSIERGQHEGFKFKSSRVLLHLEAGEEWQLKMFSAGGSYRPSLTMILEDASASQLMTARYRDVEGRVFCTSTAVERGAKTPFIEGE